MILDSGICTIFRKVDVAERGNKPRFEYQRITRKWYGELEYANNQAYPSEHREEVQTDGRIRILQDRRLNNHDVVLLMDAKVMQDEAEAYEITRAYHGRDEDSGELITDLTLRRVKP